MKNLRTSLVSVAVAALVAGAAIAHGYDDHFRGSGGAQGAVGPWTMTPGGQMPGMMGAPGYGMMGGPGYGMMGGPGMMGGAHGMMPMMQMMMGMHGGMMGAGMSGMDMVNGAGTGMMRAGVPGMGMMGGMPGMGAVLPGLDADTDGNGEVTAEELRDRLQALLGEFDADGNGSLSLEEFAALHAALIRETMVDRFQFLDADGDGAVTADEITEPADRLEQMQAQRQRMMQAGLGQPGMMIGKGSMTQAGPRQPGMMRDQGGMMQDR